MKKNFIFHLLLIFTHILPAVFVPALVFSQNTFIVNSLGDNPDLLAGDGVCLDATGSCSLRAAIEEANALPGRDSIAFAIAGAGPFTIAPSSTLPSIAEPLVLDASTQAGYSPGNPQIVLDGGGSLSTALLIQADNCVVRGFCLGNFQMGIRLLGSNNRIEANFIGLAADGNTAFPNVQYGVFITPGSSGNVIGGQSASQRNVISGNGGAGISITDGSNTLIAANYLGTNKDGSAAVPNANGVFIFSSGGSPSGHLLGGSGPEAGNLISGNAVSGIQIVGGNSIAIQGNFIGTNAAGDQAIANGSYGINFFSFGIEHISIGGSAPGAGNLISGNGQIGIFIQGINHQVQGNLIGTQADGLSPLPNGEAGIQVEGALGVAIGGQCPQYHCPPSHGRHTPANGFHPYQWGAHLAKLHFWQWLHWY
ncbi:MAG: hypothetical protein D6730_07780 [Bacteroidetes bacterium]|nr:MAG: hypothetical protein D6730_07780 [Bacteroidota bacterium]